MTLTLEQRQEAMSLLTSALNHPYNKADGSQFLYITEDATLTSSALSMTYIITHSATIPYVRNVDIRLIIKGLCTVSFPDVNNFGKYVSICDGATLNVPNLLTSATLGIHSGNILAPSMTSSEGITISNGLNEALKSDLSALQEIDGTLRVFNPAGEILLPASIKAQEVMLGGNMPMVTFDTIEANSLSMWDTSITVNSLTITELDMGNAVLAVTELNNLNSMYAIRLSEGARIIMPKKYEQPMQVLYDGYHKSTLKFIIVKHRLAEIIYLEEE